MLYELAVVLDGAWAERAEGFLDALGANGTAMEDAGETPVFAQGTLFQRCRLKAYFEDPGEPASLADRLRLFLEQQGLSPVPEVSLAPLPDQDWDRAWKESLPPLPVGDRLLVLPTWLSPPPGNDRILLTLDPETAFGSGHHETTQGCLEALEARAASTPLGRVLDMGTGSGILAIAALKLGALSVVATDNDPEAIRVCLRNAEQNQATNGLVVVLHETVPGGPFDTIVANILAMVLLEHARSLVAALAPGGEMVLSGILAQEADEVAARFGGLGLGNMAVRILGAWAVVTGSKEKMA